MGKHVTLLFSYGQSNELGNEANASIPTIYLTSRGDVKMWQGSGPGFVDLKNNTNTYPQINTGLHAPEFARNWDLVNRIGYDVRNYKYAEGGTSMADYWKVNGSLYIAAKAELTTVINAVVAAGKTYTLIGLMNQGEHDSNDLTRSLNYANLYAAQLADLLSSFNFSAYLCTLTRSNIGGSPFLYTANVIAAQQLCINNIKNGVVTIPGFTVVNSGGLYNIDYIDCSDLNAGDLHYGEPGYTTLGQRQAQFFGDRKAFIFP